jgi:uncharacterized membrane protein
MSDAASDPGPHRHLLAELVHTIERDPTLDHRAERLSALSGAVGRSAAGPVLRGRPIGHALHPAMTDLPLGCWTSAAVLDLLGGRRCRTASQRLVAIGLLGTVPTVLTGLAEFEVIEPRAARRVATAHAAGNGLVAGLQLLSWRSRRRGRHVRGVVWGLAGTGLSLVTGYLGGHLISHDGVGVGPRWGEHPDTAASDRGGSVETTEAGMPPAPLPDEVALDPRLSGADVPLAGSSALGGE